MNRAIANPRASNRGIFEEGTTGPKAQIVRQVLPMAPVRWRARGAAQISRQDQTAPVYFTLAGLHAKRSKGARQFGEIFPPGMRPWRSAGNHGGRVSVPNPDITTWARSRKRGIPRRPHFHGGGPKNIRPLRRSSQLSRAVARAEG